MNQIGLDIGGTKIAAAVFDCEGRILAEDVIATPVSYQLLLSVCTDIIKKYQALGAAEVGVGLPGQIHAVTRHVTAPNIPYLTDMPFLGDLGKLAGCIIHGGNDADCAALAEACEGAGKGENTCFMVTLGTGVGGAYVLNGKTLLGANGLTCEIGHLPLPCYDPRTDGVMPICNCGRPGCAEAFVNVAGFGRLAARYGFAGLEPAQLPALLDADTRAVAMLDNYCDLLAKLLANVVFSYDPSVIILGGGLAQLPHLIEGVNKKWARYVLGKPLLTQLRLAELGTKAGVRGAALLAGA